jgi:hypothetical protein
MTPWYDLFAQAGRLRQLAEHYHRLADRWPWDVRELYREAGRLREEARQMEGCAWEMVVA